MILFRLFSRLPRPRMNFVAIDDMLTQLRVYRFLCGGLFVKMDGRWQGVIVAIVLADGSRVFRLDDGSPGSFHETFNGIQQLEDHT